MRDRIQIMAEILALCTQKRRKTSVRIKTNLAYGQLQAYLSLLTSMYLLAHNSDEYVTTEKGYRFLRAFTQLEASIKNDAQVFDSA